MEKMMSDECKHGSLRRSCEICERDVEIERLRAEVDRLERALNGAVKKLTRLEAARAARISKSSSITGGWG